MFFKKLFGKNEETNNNDVLAAPATGKFVPLEEVPDPVFSQKMMGDGVAVDPTEGLIVAPIDAEVLQVFPTKHAVGLKTSNNTEILIHIGLETVALKGEGFEAHVKEGDKVKKGDKLISFDLDIIRTKAKSTITPVIITNTDAVGSITKGTETALTKGQTTVMTVTPKQ
ncbi:PTS sugar transporter subunit IIA [Bacillus testis]|uniref:PTS sugar transporter subunit IIA n=1 Tax=Bacillus testis TaxID=1622072 RepID=UPI00067ED6A8|nr:PTS glucose transporter subunit IIA [Bacillus testis]